MHKRNDLKERVIGVFFFLNGLFAVIILAGIFVLLATKAAPAFREIRVVDFLFKSNWNPTATFVLPAYEIGRASCRERV